MVGDLSFNAFTRDELLAKHLAGSFTTTVHCSVDSCLVSGLEVVIAGISKYMVKTTEVQWAWLVGVISIDEPRLLWQWQHRKLWESLGN